MTESFHRDTCQTIDPGRAAATPRIFHRVMDATLINVRRALEDMRDRFDSSTDPDTLDRLELVLAEVLNNITLHGAGGQPAPGALAVEGQPLDRWSDERLMQNLGVLDARESHLLPDRALAFSNATRILIHLTVTQHNGGLACAVIDNGTPLPETCLVFPETRPPPEVSALRAGGFGWYIIRDLTRSLFYFREDSRNVLCFNIPRRSARRSDPSAIGVA